MVQINSATLNASVTSVNTDVSAHPGSEVSVNTPSERVSTGGWFPNNSNKWSSDR